MSCAPTLARSGSAETNAWALPVRQLARTVAAVVQDSAADFHLVADLDG
ncbi:hypothetical protein ABT371_11595 [Streptomyces rochei]|nr:hypothetical protein [Streptomyces plicatus]